MQWPFYGVLAAPKNIGLRSRQTAILSVQVRLLIVGPLQHHARCRAA